MREVIENVPLMLKLGARGLDPCELGGELALAGAQAGEFSLRAVALSGGRRLHTA